MKNKKILPVLLSLLWILLLFSGYYWGHKPFGIDLVKALGAFCLDLVLVSLVVVLAGGIGRKWLPFSNLSAWERAGLHVAAGMGFLSILWFCLGIFSLYYRLVAWVVLVGGLFLFRKFCFDWLTEVRLGLVALKRLLGYDKIVLLILVLLVVGQILLAAAPAVKYDALSYHLQLPRVYIEQHRLAFVEENPYWGHPQLAEMLFTWMGLLHRLETAALLNAAWGILLLMGVMSTVQRLASSLMPGQTEEESRKSNPAVRAGLVATAALLVGSTFRYLLGWAYSDLLAAWMGWSLLFCSLEVLRTPDKRWMPWVGIFSGLAIGTKWTAGIAALGVFLYLFGVRKRIQLSLRNWLFGGVLAVLLVFPWLAKNTFATSNPLYPYLIPGEWVGAQRLEAASSYEQPLGMGQVILFPFTSTLFGWDSAAGYSADLGPLLLLLCVPGLWALRKDDVGRLTGLCLALCWLFIVLGNLFFNHLQQTRLYFVLLPFTAVTAGLGWVYLCRLRIPVLRVSALLNALLMLVLVLTLMQDTVLLLRQAPARVVFGMETEEEYLDRVLGWYAPATRALYELPDNSQVLMLWEGRALYAPLSVYADPWIDRWRVDYWHYRATEKILQSWQVQGYTHLLFYQKGAEAVRLEGSPLEESGWIVLDELLGMLPQPVSFGDAYFLYSLGERVVH